MPSKPRSDVVRAGGLRLRYLEWGRADAPHVLILHGITSLAWEFAGVAEALAGDYHVIALDQRGHGESGRAGGYTVDAMAEDVAGVIETLGLAPGRLVGHSMGGIVGYFLAARRPELVERFAMLDVGPMHFDTPFAEQQLRPFLAAAADPVEATPEEVLAEWLAGSPRAHESELRRYIVHNLRPREDGRWQWRFDGPGLLDFVDRFPSLDEQWDTLRHVRCPVLVVRAAESAVTDAATAARMSEELPHARVVEVAASGHDLHIDQPAVLYRLLREFLGQA